MTSTELSYWDPKTLSTELTRFISFSPFSNRLHYDAIYEASVEAVAGLGRNRRSTDKGAAEEVIIGNLMVAFYNIGRREGFETFTEAFSKAIEKNENLVGKTNEDTHTQSGSDDSVEPRTPALSRRNTKTK